MEPPENEDRAERPLSMLCADWLTLSSWRFWQNWKASLARPSRVPTTLKRAWPSTLGGFSLCGCIWHFLTNSVTLWQQAAAVKALLHSCRFRRPNSVMSADTALE